MRTRTVLFLGVFFCLFAAGNLWAEVRVQSTFDKRTVPLDEEVRLTIRISGADGNIQAPRLPSFRGFDTFYTGRSSQITFENGVSSSMVEFTYSLVAREQGRHRVGPIQISVSGQTYVTEPVDIEVVPSNAPRPTQPPVNSNFPLPPAPPPGSQSSQPLQEPPPAFVPEDDNIFVQTWVDKPSVFVNEQILLSYSLYTRYDTRYEGFDKEPQVSGFWIEDFPMDQDIRRETVRVEGKRYIKADVKKMALFPTAAAEYTIDPGTLKVSIRKEPESSSLFDEFFNDSFFSGGSFFARRENRILAPPPIKVTVKPLPEEGKPLSFQGAVGNFRMSGTIDKPQIKQNEPVTLTLVIEGEGNVETLNKPALPESPAFKTYVADSSSNLYRSGNVIGGRKTFEIIFIPIKAGQMAIPKIEFSFFNPAIAAYRTLSTQEFPLQVEASKETFKLPEMLTGDEDFKKGIEMEGKDIRYIHETLPDRTWQQVFYLLLMALAGLNVLSTGLVATGIARRSREQLYAKDIALKRRREARAKAESGMRRLKLARGNAAFFDETEKVLTQYLSDKFNLSTHGITRSELVARLSEALGATDPLLEDVRDFYQVCDEARFARAQVAEDKKARALEIMKAVMRRVEKRK